MSAHERAATATEPSPSLWKNRTFLRFFLGQFVSNAGDSLYTVAILWLVFELSGSTALTGLASSLLLLPYLLQIIAGPIVDRFPLKPLLVGSQVLQGVVVLVLPLAAYTGTLTVELIMVLIPVLSVVGLVVSPIQSALLPRILAEDQLSRGNSALATVTLGLDMLFDALGGLFIALFGATTLFLVDSVTFAVATTLFVGMTIPAVKREDGESDAAESSVLDDYVADLRAGIDVLRGTLFVPLLATSAVFNFAVGVTLAILPAFGETLGGPAVYGFLLGALGVGRLVGSVAASWLNGVAYGRLKTATFLLSALLWVGSVYAPTVALTVGLFGFAWVSAGADDVLTATLNQTVFPDQLLGRVSAIKGTAATATLPLGSLVGGLIGAVVGTTTTMALAAAGFGFVGVYFLLRPSLRSIPSIREAEPGDFGLQEWDSSAN